MEIVPANQNDLDALVCLIGECVRHMDAQGIHQWDDIYPDRAVIETDVTNGLLYVAREEGVCRAMVTVHDYQPSEYGPIEWQYPADRLLVVHRLAVHPNCEGGGIGKKLMEFVEDMARSGGYEAIRLDAFPQNPRAVSLYENLGYRKAGSVIFRKGLFFLYEKSFKPSPQPFLARGEEV
jgi:ribosomal protein S18 acetylase RimI-like enzyme